MSQESAGFRGSVEFTDAFRPRADIRHVVFDFDGTLSLIRQGWPEVMIPMFLEMIPRASGESERELEQSLYDDVMELNGKQTIYQMIRFAERVKRRDGTALDPLDLKHEYLRRLDDRIGDRVGGLDAGELDPDEWLVYGARNMLELLRDRGYTLHLLSGTDEPFVIREAGLLGISHFFGERIQGAQDDYESFSKRMAVERICHEHQVSGEHLLAFGDGFVEIQVVVERGGLAIAVASDEAHRGSGVVDPWKRDRLVGVGAHLVIPDYRDAHELIKVVVGQE